MPLGLEHGHPLLRVVGGVWAEDPAVGERTLRLDAEGVLVRVGRVVEVDALDEVAELEALQLRVHALVLELAQRVVGHERNVDPRELIVLLVLVVLLLLRVRRRRGLGLGGGLGLVLLLLLLAAGEGEGAREGGDALLYGVGARELLVVDLRGLVDLDAHLHPLRLDHVVAAARRLDALHLGQADPRLQHLDPLGRHGRLARAELPLALGRVERDAVLGALGLAVALLDAHGLVERDLDALAVGLGGVFVVVVVGELCLLDQGVLVLPRLRLHLEHEPAPLPRLAHGHAELGLLALLEEPARLEPARLERLLRFLDGNLLLRLDGRLDAVHVERREQLTHLTLAGGAHAQHRAVCCLEEQAPPGRRKKSTPLARTAERMSETARATMGCDISAFAFCSSVYMLSTVLRSTNQWRTHFSVSVWSSLSSSLGRSSQPWASTLSTTARTFFSEGCAAWSEAAHCNMFSLLLVASSHESKAHLTRRVCCLAECDDSVQLSTGMKPSAWPSTARLGSEKYMRIPLEKSTNQ
eukprot:scaffold55207_cov57-Phaeocystis_antarctica.AAC.1